MKPCRQFACRVCEVNMDFRLLGWISLGLAIVSASPYWLRTLNKWTFKTKKKWFTNLLRELRKIHKITGLLLAVIALYHGYLALNNNIKLHTGTLVYAAFLLTVVLGVVHYFKKDKRAFKGHKVMALVSFMLFLLHLIEPWALGKWFGIW